jgi:hypothetical protein
LKAMLADEISFLSALVLNASCAPLLNVRFIDHMEKSEIMPIKMSKPIHVQANEIILFLKLMPRFLDM